MKKLLATILLITALSLTAFAGHENIAQPDGVSATPQVCAPGHNGLARGGHQD